MECLFKESEGQCSWYIVGCLHPKARSEVKRVCTGSNLEASPKQEVSAILALRELELANAGH